MILRPALSRPLALSAIVTMVLSGLVTGALVAPAASAAPGPITARPTTAVTADALPTVQVDGVVWSQAVVGNTVYAGGQFTGSGANSVMRISLRCPANNLVADVVSASEGAARIVVIANS